MRLNNPERIITIRDITNKRARAKFINLNKDTPITAFFKDLNRKFNNTPEDEFFFRYRTKSDVKEGESLTHLFIANNKHTYFLMENPEVLTIGATYKTNRFRMFLINIIRMTGMNQNFYAASVFIAGEKEEDYNMMFSGIQMLYDFFKIPYPSTFVTDSCEAEIKALRKIFPKTNHILYIFHINNNILVKLKPKIKTEYNRENDLDSDDDNVEENFYLIKFSGAKGEEVQVITTFRIR